MKLTPKEFTTKYYSFAKTCEDNTGISAVFTLAQAALESGWGARALGNNFFGIRATKGTPANKKQTFKTFEYFNGKRVNVMGEFRKYESPEECFEDHARLLIDTPRYAEAMKVKSNPYRLCDEIAKAGYATAPDYASVLKQICRMIQRNI